MIREAAKPAAPPLSPLKVKPCSSRFLPYISHSMLNIIPAKFAGNFPPSAHNGLNIEFPPGASMCQVFLENGASNTSTAISAQDRHARSAAKTIRPKIFFLKTAPLPVQIGPVFSDFSMISTTYLLISS
ncbi:MAG TPA: hypothetical protein VMT38_12740 [Terracidiphilus sp.]|nr:hypothetical protein [Terracidiphilus sp.]